MAFRLTDRPGPGHRDESDSRGSAWRITGFSCDRRPTESSSETPRAVATTLLTTYYSKPSVDDAYDSPMLPARDFAVLKDADFNEKASDYKGRFRVSRVCVFAPKAGKGRRSQ